MKYKTKVICYILLAILINISLCFGMSLFKKPEYYLASFEGKVVDTDTKKPVEGAVVLAIYHKTVHTIAGSNSYVVDGQETLTDANGEFRISSKIVRSEEISGKPRGSIVIFKPGYGLFPDHKRSEAVGVNKSWPPPGKYVVYEIPKLKTKSERRWNRPGAFSFKEIPYENQKLFINAINEERKKFGLSPLSVPKKEN